MKYLMNENLYNSLCNVHGFTSLNGANYREHMILILDLTGDIVEKIRSAHTTSMAENILRDNGIEFTNEPDPWSYANALHADDSSSVLSDSRSEAQVGAQAFVENLKGNRCPGTHTIHSYGTVTIGTLGSHPIPQAHIPTTDFSVARKQYTYNDKVYDLVYFVQQPDVFVCLPHNSDENETQVGLKGQDIMRKDAHWIEIKALQAKIRIPFSN